MSLNIQWKARTPQPIFFLETFIIFVAVTLLLPKILDVTDYLDNASCSHLFLGIPYLGVSFYIILILLGCLSGSRYALITPLSVNIAILCFLLTDFQNESIITVFKFEHLFSSNYGVCAYLLSYLLFFIYSKGVFHSIKEKLKRSSQTSTSSAQSSDAPILPVLLEDDINIANSSDGGHYAAIATSFSDVLVKYTDKETKRSFSIGIDGRWGSGKTYFLELLLASLRNKSKKLKIIRFNAWHSVDTNLLVKDFFNEWKEQFSNDIGLPTLIDNYVNVIIEREKDIFGTSFANLLKLAGDSGENNFLKQIQASIERKTDERFCFVIDDIDRLDKEELQIILKLCRIMADFPNTIYLIAYDRVYVDSILESTTNPEKSKSFLDKIVQLEFKVPFIEDALFLRMLEKILNAGAAGVVEKHEIKRILEKYNRYIDYYLDGVRDIKRFSNILFTRYFCVRESVNFEIFFLVTLIEQREKGLFRVLAANENQYTWFSANDQTTLNAFYTVLKEKHYQPLAEITKELLTLLVKNDSASHSFRRNFEFYLLGSKMSQLRQLESFMSEKLEINAFKSKASIWFSDINDKTEVSTILGLYIFRFIKSSTSTDPLTEPSKLELARRVIWLYLILLKEKAANLNEILRSLFDLSAKSAALFNSEVQGSEWSGSLTSLPEDYNYGYYLPSDINTVCAGIEEATYLKNRNDVQGFMKNFGANRKPGFIKKPPTNFAQLGKMDVAWGDLVGAKWLHPNFTKEILDPIRETPFEYNFTFVSLGKMNVTITVLVDDDCTISIDNNRLPHQFKGFGSINPSSKLDITEYVKKGLNTITFYVINSGGGPTGLCFRIDFKPIKNDAAAKKKLEAE